MKLKGKLIGGILGACFGGPFGIALGVAIGHVCDSVADSSELSLAARSKFIELACEGISKIAKADGRVSEWFIQNFVRRITPIDDTRFAWVLDLAPEPQTLVCEVNGRKEYPRITLESNLYRGAWPPPGASRPTFLINRNGRMNGDISVEGLEHDRLQSKGFIGIGTTLGTLAMRKISPPIFQVGMVGEIFCCMRHP